MVAATISGSYSWLVATYCLHLFQVGLLSKPKSSWKLSKLAGIMMPHMPLFCNPVTKTHWHQTDSILMDSQNENEAKSDIEALTSKKIHQVALKSPIAKKYRGTEQCNIS